jgi:NAD(P)H-hydrate repair Nnr-like enzyme with NAD(P)H-hydrate dehydratase domain
MIRYLGASRPAEEVLRRRPEVVTAPGRVQAWLIGSGMDASTRPQDDAVRLRRAIEDGTPLVIDAGALDLVRDASGPVVITPHYRELAGVIARAEEGDAQAPSAADIADDPGGWALRASHLLGVTVLLKGHTTHVATPAGTHRAVTAGPPWLATAGSGDVLGGVLGALVATHERELSGSREEALETLAALAATAAWVHGRAGESASNGGPIVALDIAGELAGVVRDLVTGGQA